MLALEMRETSYKVSEKNLRRLQNDSMIENDDSPQRHIHA